jgi:HEAT repeat protein
MTSSEILQLFSNTITGDYEDENAWEAVSALQKDGSRETFDTAAKWIRAEEPLKRARAAAVLAQLRQPGWSGTGEPIWMFRDESFALVIEMLESENEALVLGSGISALGHLRNSAAIPVILKYLNHPDQDVRFSAALALGCFPDDELAISGLLALTQDEDADVRDWAVFGLGVQGSADLTEIRAALLRCLSDVDEDVREEAAVGLGKRKDLRLLPVLRGMLDAPDLKSRVAEAASALLSLPEDPTEWSAGDYKDALQRQFGSDAA